MIRYPCSVAVKCGGEVREYRVAIKRRRLCDRCAEYLGLR